MKMFPNVPFFLVAIVLFSACVNADDAVGNCEHSGDRLGLHYTVVEQPNNDAQPSVRHLQIWRQERQVALVFEERQITQIWDLVVDGRQKLTRYFDAYERAIEYQPEDVSTATGEDAWSARTQIISDSARSAMPLVDRTGSGCDVLETYEHFDEHSRQRLVWIPSIRAVKSFTSSSEAGEISWQLQEQIVDAERVQGFYDSKSAYQSTDYIDIGDNESDPFLMQMMNLGSPDLSPHHAGH